MPEVFAHVSTCMHELVALPITGRQEGVFGFVFGGRVLCGRDWGSPVAQLPLQRAVMHSHDTRGALPRIYRPALNACVRCSSTAVGGPCCWPCLEEPESWHLVSTTCTLFCPHAGPCQALSCWLCCPLLSLVLASGAGQAAGTQLVAAQPAPRSTPLCMLSLRQLHPVTVCARRLCVSPAWAAPEGVLGVQNVRVVCTCILELLLVTLGLQQARDAGLRRHSTLSVCTLVSRCRCWLVCFCGIHAVTASSGAGMQAQLSSHWQLCISHKRLATTVSFHCFIQDCFGLLIDCSHCAVQPLRWWDVRALVQSVRLVPHVGCHARREQCLWVHMVVPACLGRCCLFQPRNIGSGCLHHIVAVSHCAPTHHSCWQQQDSLSTTAAPYQPRQILCAADTVCKSVRNMDCCHPLDDL